jgi:predicted alpha/beta superfamily hydrolase
MKYYQFFGASCLVMIVAVPPVLAAQYDVIVTPPHNYQVQDEIYLVGNFNDWMLNGPSAKKLTYANGKLTAQIDTALNDLHFTFVKNADWQHMPASLSGKSLCTFYQSLDSKGDVVYAEIPAWKTDVPIKEEVSSLSGNVKTLKAFANPYFKRTDDIVIYLPPSYKTASTKSYPVLYMLDGQNVFDAATAYSSEWQLDEILERLIAQHKLDEMIVVAVPNSPARWIEYNPWPFKNAKGELQQGGGDLTMQFITKTLKPYMEENYRIKRSWSGLAGSSLGGLMALYAALEYSDQFSYVAAFSPALDIHDITGNNVLFRAVEQKKFIKPTKIYMDIGKFEYGDFDRIEELESIFRTKGVSLKQLHLVKDELGRHCEEDWSKRFPAALQWLMSSDK